MTDVSVESPKVVATLDPKVAPKYEETGSTEVNFEGEVKSGMEEALVETMLPGKNDLGYDYTMGKMVFPAGTYGVRQTNDALKNPIFADTNVDAEKGVKLSECDFAKAMTSWFFIKENGTVVYEFDWDYTGAEGQEFKADYTVTFTTDGLIINN